MAASQISDRSILHTARIRIRSVQTKLLARAETACMTSIGTDFIKE